MNESTVTKVNAVPGKISRISWAAVLAGTLTAFSLMFLLNILGLGIGLTSIDPLTDADPFKGLGIGTAIWWILSNVASLFTGGLVAARMSGYTSNIDGALHGFLTWALYFVLGLIMLTSAVGGILNGLGNMVSGVVGGDGSEDITVQVEEALSSGKEETQGIAKGIQDQMFQLINAGEEYNILPSDASEETSKAIQDSKSTLKQMNLKEDIQSFVSDLSFELDQNGDLNIQGNGTDELINSKELKQSLTENTDLSEAEIDGVIKKWETKLQTAVDKAEKFYADAKLKVQEYSEKATDAAGTAAIVAFLILLLSGGAAFFGGITGSPDYNLLVTDDRTSRGKIVKKQV